MATNMIEDEWHKAFPPGGPLDTWMRERREELFAESDRFKSDAWWAQLSVDEREQWLTKSRGTSVVEAWLAFRTAQPSSPL